MVCIIPKYRVMVRLVRIGVYRIEYFSHFHNIDSNALDGVDNTERKKERKKEGIVYAEQKQTTYVSSNRSSKRNSNSS